MSFTYNKIEMFHELYFRNKTPMKVGEEKKYYDIITTFYYTEDEYINILFDYMTGMDEIIYYTTQLHMSRSKETIKKIPNEVKKEKLKNALSNMGWLNYKGITTEKGDFNEYLMCIVIDDITSSIRTLIPKVSLKTSPDMPVFGDDNIFYDAENKCLYFGESKMFKSFSSALDEACDSIKSHEGARFNWISTNTRTFKEIYGENELVEEIEYNTEYLDNIKKAVIIFVTSETLEPRYSAHSKKIKELFSKGYIVYAVHFPVISIDNLIDVFFKRIGEDYGY